MILFVPTNSKKIYVKSKYAKMLIGTKLVLFFFCVLVDRSLKRRQVKPLAASLLDALDYDSSDDSDFEVGDASGKNGLFDFFRLSNILFELDLLLKIQPQVFGLNRTFNLLITVLKMYLYVFNMKLKKQTFFL